LTTVITHESRNESDPGRSIPTELSVGRAFDESDTPVVDLHLALDDGVWRMVTMPLDVAERLSKALASAVRAQKNEPAEVDAEVVG
jgi:hypothetical protein